MRLLYRILEVNLFFWSFLLHCSLNSSLPVVQLHFTPSSCSLFFQFCITYVIRHMSDIDGGGIAAGTSWEGKPATSYCHIYMHAPVFLYIYIFKVYLSSSLTLPTHT